MLCYLDPAPCSFIACLRDKAIFFPMKEKKDIVPPIVQTVSSPLSLADGKAVCFRVHDQDPRMSKVDVSPDISCAQRRKETVNSVRELKKEETQG